MKEFITGLHPFLVIAAGVANLAMAVWTLVAAPKGRAKIAFAHTAFSIAGYLIFFGIISLIPDIRTAYWVGCIGEFFAHQISPAFYSFSVYFLNLERQKRVANLAFPIGLCVTLLVMNLPGHGITQYWWGRFNSAPVSVAGWYLALYFVFFVGFMILSFVNLFYGYRQATNAVFKRQIQYIIIAFSVAYIGGLDHLPWIGYSWYPFGYLPTTIFTFIVSYAFVRHRLMEANVFFGRAFALILVYSILFTLLIPTTQALTKLFLVRGFSSSSIAILLAFLIGTVLSTGPFIYARFIRESFWLKGNATAGLVHELKSPLVAIHGALEYLSNPNSSEAPPEIRREYLEIIERNSERLELFVDDLLKIAQIQEGSVSLDRKPFDLGQLINEVSLHLKPNMTKKSLLTTMDLLDTAPIVADRMKTYQIVSNLLSNAIKYSENGQVHIDLSRENHHYTCTVKDDGQGVSKENLTRIFDRFFQTSKSAKGAGLGLAIAKAWVEAHGGKIWAESEGEGRGTKVTFTLPVG